MESCQTTDINYIRPHQSKLNCKAIDFDFDAIGFDFDFKASDFDVKAIDFEFDGKAIALWGRCNRW